MRQQIEKTVWGQFRHNRSYAIVWTAIYKGHNLLPRQAHAMRCARMVYDIAHNFDENTKNLFVELWHHEDGDDEEEKHDITTPISAANFAFEKMGWTWTMPFSFDIETSLGQQTCDFDTQE